MVDAALGPPPPRPRRATDWRAGLGAVGRGLRDAYRRHPWALRVPISAPPLGPEQRRLARRRAALRWPTTPLSEQREALDACCSSAGFVRNEATLTADFAAGVGRRAGDARLRRRCWRRSPSEAELPGAAPGDRLRRAGRRRRHRPPSSTSAWRGSSTGSRRSSPEQAREPAGPRGAPGQGGPDRVLGPAHDDRASGPGDGGVQQLAGEDRRGRPAAAARRPRRTASPGSCGWSSRRPCRPPPSRAGLIATSSPWRSKTAALTAVLAPATTTPVSPLYRRRP